LQLGTIREHLKVGRLRGKKQSKRWYVPEQNFQDFFDEEPQGDE
jgi:hypothetical protein